MKPVLPNKFLGQLESLPPSVQDKFYKQLDYLLDNLRHPSLRSKKYNEAENIWQARINGHYRFYFQIIGDTYLIVTITKHPK